TERKKGSPTEIEICSEFRRSAACDRERCCKPPEEQGIAENQQKHPEREQHQQGERPVDSQNRFAALERWYAPSKSRPDAPGASGIYSRQPEPPRDPARKDYRLERIPENPGDYEYSDNNYHDTHEK